MTLPDINNQSITTLDGKNTITALVDTTDATLNGTAKILPDKVLSNNGLYLISADDINVLFGFSWKYDEAANILYFVK